MGDSLEFRLRTLEQAYRRLQKLCENKYYGVITIKMNAGCIDEVKHDIRYKIGKAKPV